MPSPCTDLNSRDIFCLKVSTRSPRVLAGTVQHATCSTILDQLEHELWELDLAWGGGGERGYSALSTPLIQFVRPDKFDTSDLELCPTGKLVDMWTDKTLATKHFPHGHKLKSWISSGQSLLFWDPTNCTSPLFHFNKMTVAHSNGQFQLTAIEVACWNECPRPFLMRVRAWDSQSQDKP